jgi:hypothetical protein
MQNRNLTLPASPLLLSALAVMMLANSLAAEAKSETECRPEARQATGDSQGLDFERALVGCMLDNSPQVKAPAAVIIQKTEEPTVIEKTEQPTVAFPANEGGSAGTWVRVSPHRWTLKR